VLAAAPRAGTRRKSGGARQRGWAVGVSFGWASASPAKQTKIVLLAAGEVCSTLSPAFSSWNSSLNILSMIRDHTSSPGQEGNLASICDEYKYFLLIR
jgi:hypothetical protein